MALEAAYRYRYDGEIIGPNRDLVDCPAGEAIRTVRQTFVPDDGKLLDVAVRGGPYDEWTSVFGRYFRGCDPAKLVPKDGAPDRVDRAGAS